MYQEILQKRLERRKAQVEQLTETHSPTTENKRTYIELRAVIAELENIIDIADTLSDLQAHNVT